MAAILEIDEYNGPNSTTTHNVSTLNWKTVDDATTPFSSAPIPRGSYSMNKWIAGHFSGSYNLIKDVKFAHTDGSLDAGLTLKAQPSMTSINDMLVYTTPSLNKNKHLVTDLTSPTTINNGLTLWLGEVDPSYSDKTPTTTMNPAWTTWIGTQLQVASTASLGSTSILTFTVQWTEN